MADTVRWRVILARPGEPEMALLAELASRRDCRIVAVIDPGGQALGTAIAEVMQIPVLPDLADLTDRTADYLVYPDGNGEINDIVAEAQQRGLPAVTGRDFARILHRKSLYAPPPLIHAERESGYLERETAVVHRTLSRIEEALERESLLRWLLSLATRSVSAASGSLMLFDRATEELYIAFAYGLSEGTLHRTRVRLGESIAGRVALSRRAELIRGNQHPGETRDRPAIGSAVSIPLSWEGELLGVLNVSAAAGDPPLGQPELEVLSGLSHRLALILNRFLQLQEAQGSEGFRRTDHELHAVADASADLPATLAGWCSVIAEHAGAFRVGLALTCADGSLLNAEAAAGEEPRTWHETLENAALFQVLETGAPLVVREQDELKPGAEQATYFYLPLGHDPVHAVLTVGFATSQAGHRFHGRSGQLVYLLERHLSAIVRRAQQHDRLERMTALSSVLTELAPHLGAADHESRQRLLAAARRLTGARQAYLVTAIVAGRAQLDGLTEQETPAWAPEAARLLSEAHDDRWRQTVLSDVAEPREEETCLLVMPATAESATPALILVGKERLHPLDGSVFTDQDAQIAGRLAALAVPLLAPIRTELKEVPQPAAAPPADGEPTVAAAPPQREVVIDLLRREMDRCDRYHTVFALAALRADLPADPQGTLVRGLARRLGEKVRSSDHVACLDDGTVLLIAPEDVQSLGRMQQRLIAMVREIAGRDDLKVAAVHTVYPGRHDTPEQLLAETLDALTAAR